MEMSQVEKSFVNRHRKVKRNVDRVGRRVLEIDAELLQDALEIGCGIGDVSAFLAYQCGMNVSGTDVDLEGIELARVRHAESNYLRFVVEDATRLSLEDSSFDLVVSQKVFHHIPDWHAAVREVARVLRPGGYLIWFDLVFPKWINVLLKALAKRSGVYSREEVVFAFAQSGFQTKPCELSAPSSFCHHELMIRKA